MKKHFALILVIVIIGSIFYLSSIPGLRVMPVLRQVHTLVVKLDFGIAELGESIAHKLPIDTNELNPVRTISGDFYSYARENPRIIEFLLRKLAHVTIFFFLTVALFILFYQYIKKPSLAVFCAFFIATVLAFLDEYHQYFVDNRVGSFIDVGIDMLGIFTAIFFIYFSLFITRRWIEKEKN